MADQPASKKRRTLATQAVSEGERLHIRIPPDLKEVARVMASEQGRTVSNFVLQLLREEAKRQGRKN
jgi:uncharacterized protein (DUF1778 family)